MTAPQHGMSDIEYDAIEAAVSETARGRRFLAEFARRNRLAEMRQLLDAMARLEAAVAGDKPALPSASMRLLAQRIAEVSRRLGDIADEMRDAGVEEHFFVAVAAEGRAVAGMMRAATLPAGGKPPASASEPPPLVRRPAPAALPAATEPADPRLAALASLDALPLPEKLALFR